jgi:hypothetical protein
MGRDVFSGFDLPEKFSFEDFLAQTLLPKWVRL